ncbi:MAG: carotenoid biosynthesis protein [Caldilinea sp. CFX5]|nr:carotenoid biosynthesis protein [Caldilinea sp. CFX5]
MTTQLYQETEYRTTTANIKQQDKTPTSTSNRLPLYLALIPLGLLVYQDILVTAGNLPTLPVSEAGVAMFVALFSLLHSFYLLGWRNTLVMFGITAVVSWGFEQAGVATGLIYGAYHYGEALGPKLGHVPYAIPVAWYSMLYPSYVMALLLTDGSVGHARLGLGSIVRQALVGGMVMTAWDVLVDPLASGPNALSWVWEQGGEFYGVPTQNFAGWVLTAFTVILLYRLYERRFPAHPLGAQTRLVLALPLIVYGLVAVQMMLRHDTPSEWVVLTAFVMGFPWLAAFSQLFRPPLTDDASASADAQPAWWQHFQAQGYYVRYAMLLTLCMGMGLHITHLIVGRERFLQEVLTPNVDRLLALLIAYSALTGWLAWRRFNLPTRWQRLLYGLLVIYFTSSLVVHGQTFITGDVAPVIRLFPENYSGFILVVMAAMALFIGQLRFVAKEGDHVV